MKNIMNITVLVFTLFFGCTVKPYHLEEVDNPVYKPNKVFSNLEDLTSEKFQHLKAKYMLDTVVSGETNEFKRILLLRNWVKSRIQINDYGDPYPNEKSAEGILDEAIINGQGYHCGHFMLVQNDVMNAYGYIARPLGAGPGVEGADGHHGINEIWSNDFQKWFLSDAKYNHHFEKNGIPLSVLEIREEYLKNEGADIQVVKGISREPIEEQLEYDHNGDEFYRSKFMFTQIYTWAAWHADFIGKVVMYDDDFYKDNVWLRNGKPHWTYNHPSELILVEDRDVIEWTPNTITAIVTIDVNQATVKLDSETPSFKEYQMMEAPSEEWLPISDSVTLKLDKSPQEFLLRAVNLADVTGPEYKILFKN
tara:strand:+ start:1565 stop:2659 length:1095 start_codon:yes stop_codon:yes gene_type:complete